MIQSYTSMIFERTDGIPKITHLFSLNALTSLVQMHEPKKSNYVLSIRQYRFLVYKPRELPTTSHVNCSTFTFTPLLPQSINTGNDSSEQNKN